MKRNERVVRSIPDYQGNPYTKTSEGGQERMTAAANYMDQRENLQLYKYEHGTLLETNRYEAAQTIHNTETNYQQHLAFTTKLNADDNYVSEYAAAEHIAKTVQERRPDAEIYSVSVHSDGDKAEPNIHIHVAFGTRTTLRRDDFKYFRQQAYELEQEIENENQRDLTEDELEWIKKRLEQKKRERERGENEQA